MDKSRKPIQINRLLHNQLKNYCKANGLVLKALIEKLIKEILEKNGNSIST
jgi:hypothetical protein